MVDSTLFKKLADVVGPKYVSDEPFVLNSYSQDFGAMPPSRPDIVVRPGTTEEVAAILKIANEHQVPVVPAAAGRPRRPAAPRRRKAASSSSRCGSTASLRLTRATGR